MTRTTDAPIGLFARRGPLWLAGCILTAGPTVTACAQTSTSFGYREWATRAEWPTLAVLVDFEPVGQYDLAEWDDYVFDPENQPDGLNRYFQESSLGQFLLTAGDTVRIVEPLENNSSNTLARVGRDDLDLVFHSNLVHAVMHSQQFAFADYDANHNGTVSSDELLLIFLLEGEGGAVRWAGRVTCDHSPVDFEGKVATAPLAVHAGAFSTMAHEMCHLLKAVDLYGVWGTDQDINQRLSLMSSGLVYLDPWHKMRFGWCEPRKRKMKPGGRISIPAGQLGRVDGPVILYDLDQGIQEYFLLEYRSPSNAVHGAGYDREVAGDGLVIWHVYHNSAKDIVPYCDLVYSTADRDWFECLKCRALIKRPDLGAGTCAGGGTHEPTFMNREGEPQDEHTLVHNVSTAPFEDDWFRCSKCGMLYYGPSQGASDCGVGGNHAPTGSMNYSLRANTSDLVGHNNWRRCTRCQSLFFANRWVDGVHQLSGCPAGGDHIMGPYTYVVNAAWSDRTLLTRGAPDLLYGSNAVWPGGSWTPELTWYTGGNTGIRLHVYDYEPGADYLSVEWLYPDGETWVDFDHVGTEMGTISFPYNTMSEGVNAVARGGTLNIKAGQSVETLTVDKPMSIRSSGGTVTIGH